MKKTTKKNPSDNHDGKGFLTLAGEAFSVLGEEISEGKHKLIDAASEKFATVKKAIKKKFAKKKTAPVGRVKSKPVKKAAKKSKSPAKKSSKTSRKK